MRRHTLALLGGEPAFEEPVYITKALVPDEAEFAARVHSVFEATWFTNHGKLVRELEEELRAHLHVGFLAAFCNGTTALQVALRGLKLRGEVITTPFTFPATIHALHWCGLTPVFADIDPRTYNLDPASAAGVVTGDTSALLPVHCFGNPCDVRGFDALAAEYGLKVVYDAAHAFGVEHLGRPIGCWGDLSILSFHATKVFHTAEGGAVIGADASYYDDLAMLRNFAIVNEDEVRGTGVNGKLSEIHAALGLTILETALREFDLRGRLSEHYSARLADVEGVKIRAPEEDTTHNHSYFPIEIDEERFGLSRDEVNLALRAENIFARKYFFPLCSENEAYRNHPSAHPSRLPHAHRLATRILCLPNYGDLGIAGADRIVESLVALHESAPLVRSRLGAPRGS